MAFFHDHSLPPLFPQSVLECCGSGQAILLKGLKDKHRLEKKGRPLFVPTPYRILQNVVAVSTCIHRNAAIDCNADLWTWGAKSMTLGEDGAFSNDIPQLVDAAPKKQMENALQVSQGAWHTLCITKGHRLWGWGSNENGELGIGDWKDRDAPVPIMEECVFAHANDAQSFAIKADGSLWGWGSNENGVILGGSDPCTTPVQLLDKVVSICAGSDHAFAIRDDQTLWGWGRNVSGAIFTQAQYRTCEPTLLMEDVRSVSISPSYGDGFCFVLMDDGDLYSLGNADPGSMVTYQQRRSAGQSPIKVMDHVAEIKAGHHFSLIRLVDGRVMATGENGLGQCGNGRSSGRIGIPTEIMSHSMGIGAGHHHGLGLLQNGDLWIWGGDYGHAIT